MSNPTFEEKCAHVQRVCADVSLRLDANETAHVTKELEYVKAQTYDIKYPNLKARQFIPVSNEADSGADSVVYHQWDRVGQANIVSNYADDIPLVDTFKTESTSPVRSLAVAYQYSIQDLRRSAMTGSRLDAMRARMARDFMERKIDDIAAFGDADAGLGGFLNDANVPVVATPNGDWVATATYDQIIEDMHTLVNSIVNTTNEVEIPDTLILPTSLYNFVATTKFNTATDQSILQTFMAHTPYIQTVEPWIKLEAAGAGGTTDNRMVAYRRDPVVLQLEIPQEFEQFAPQAHNLAFRVPAHARTAGVQIRYPLAVAYMDDI